MVALPNEENNPGGFLYEIIEGGSNIIWFVQRTCFILKICSCNTVDYSSVMVATCRLQKAKHPMALLRKVGV